MIKTKKCIICGKPFNYKTNKGHIIRTIRTPQSRTCSHQCSEIYKRIYKIFTANFYNKKEEITRTKPKATRNG